jgi:hypothetical protein
VNPRTSLLHPTSCYAVDGRDVEPWVVTSAEARAADEAFGNEAPLVVANLRTRMPSLADRLATDAAVLVPLVQLQEHRLCLLH